MPILRPPPTPALELLWATVKAAATVNPDYRAWRTPEADGSHSLLLFGPPQGLKGLAADQVGPLAARFSGVTDVSLRKEEWSNRGRWFVAVSVNDALRQMLAKEYLSSQVLPLSDEAQDTCFTILHTNVLPAGSPEEARAFYMAQTGLTPPIGLASVIAPGVRTWVKSHLLDKKASMRLAMVGYLASATELRAAMDPSDEPLAPLREPRQAEGLSGGVEQAEPARRQRVRRSLGRKG